MPPPETADEILDRLWENAVKQAVPAGVVDLGTPGKTLESVPESQPSKKNPIPAGSGRR
jgi:hypothetical protein